MFSVLQFVIIIVTVSMSSASTVLTIDPGFHRCPSRGYYAYFDHARMYQYYIRMHLDTTDIKVMIDFESRTLYAEVDYSKLELSAYAKSAQTGECNNRAGNGTGDWEIIWQHIGRMVAAARIVQNVSYGGDYQMDNEGCQVNVITIDDRWVYRNGTYETTKLLFERHGQFDVLKNVARRLGLACLSKRICPRVKAFLENASPYKMEQSSPITAIVNNAVDISIKYDQEFVRRTYARIIIPDLNVTAYTESRSVSKLNIFTGGTLTNLWTIERFGDAIITIEPYQYNITSTYILPEVHIHYDRYNIQTATLNETGEAFMLIKDLRFERKNTFYVRCDTYSQYINVTGIGEFKYRNPSVALEESAPRTMKGVLEYLVPKIMQIYLYKERLFDYRNTIFGPCMTRRSLVLSNVKYCSS